MFQQYILPAIAGTVILALLFGVVRRNLKDLLSVLFDLPEESDEKEKAAGSGHSTAADENILL